MNLLFRLFARDLPAPVRTRLLAELSTATAGAFASQAPAAHHRSYEDYLRAYALFTKQQAEQALASGHDLPRLKMRLYERAFPLGGKLRQWLSIATVAEVMAVARILYRAIGVDIDGDAAGNLTVSHCYFSQFYSPPVCDLISALDDGLFAGLSGGSRLVFSERLTEGKACCRARLLPRSE